MICGLFNVFSDVVMDTVAKNWFCPVSKGKSRNYPLPPFQYLSNISINTVEMQFLKVHHTRLTTCQYKKSFASAF